MAASEGHRALRFGLPPSDPGSEKREHVAALTRDLGERCGLSLQASFGTDYRNLVEELVAGRLDAAWLAPLSLLRAGGRARPVLALQRTGRRTYHGALVARRDANLVGIRDLRGKRIGWVDQDSAAGYVLTRALIAEQYPDLDAFVGAQELLGSHRAVAEAVLDGRVDVGSTFIHFAPDGAVELSGWRELLGDRAGELTPIAVTGSIPGDVIAVRDELSADETAALVSAFRTIAGDADGKARLSQVFGAEGVADPKPGEHDLLVDQARSAGWRA